MNSNNSSGTVCTLWTEGDSNNEEHREKMKYIRKLDKLNQTEFSQIIGVSQGALSDLEKDKYKPSLETVVTLKEKFDVDLDWFLFDQCAIVSNSERFNVRLNEIESNLISGFRRLNVEDKQEVEGILELKLKRYNAPQ